MFLDVPTRLARTLVKLADQHGREVEGGVQLRIRITHRELGDLIGATRETTTATMNRFQRDGLVGRKQGKLLIAAPERLQKLAKG